MDSDIPVSLDSLLHAANGFPLPALDIHFDEIDLPLTDNVVEGRHSHRLLGRDLLGMSGTQSIVSAMNERTRQQGLIRL